MKKNIGIAMGGYSSEYKISLKSGKVVCDHLNPELYEVFPLHILKDKWVCVVDGKEYPINRGDFTVEINSQTIKFDCIFNAIHGTPGEDGHLQGYLAMLNIPHTSCPMYQAALTFNKRDLLATLKPFGITSAVSFYINKGQSIDTQLICETVGLPCFVKANKAGSSFGVSKVYKEEDLKQAIEISFKEDDEIIIESFLDGTEVSVGVIRYQGVVKVLPITEIVSENDFFDYQAKYEGKSKEITPARISEPMAKIVADLAKNIYEILKMEGFSRSEFIIVDGVPYLLEMNTVPGLTTESLLPQQAEKAGISLSELFGNAIEEALKMERKL